MKVEVANMRYSLYFELVYEKDEEDGVKYSFSEKFSATGLAKVHTRELKSELFNFGGKVARRYEATSGQSFVVCISSKILVRKDKKKYDFSVVLPFLAKTEGLEERDLRSCHDCGVQIGRFHQGPCDLQRCPFCFGQLWTCDCCYIILGIDPKQELVHPQGLNENQSKQWRRILRKKGLIRYGEEDKFRFDGIRRMFSISFLTKDLHLRTEGAQPSVIEVRLRSTD